MARRVGGRSNSQKFPYVLLIAFLASIYVLWVYPQQQGTKPVEMHR